MLMRIRELREAAQMTQREFAQKLAVSSPCVHEWETGGAMPTADKLPKIAAVLGVSIDALFCKPVSIISDGEG